MAKSVANEGCKVQSRSFSGMKHQSVDPLKFVSAGCRGNRRSFMRREITKHVGLVVMFCVCSLAQAPSPQPIRRLRDGEFFSQSLQRSVKYRVLVPLSYDTGDH